MRERACLGHWSSYKSSSRAGVFSDLEANRNGFMNIFGFKALTHGIESGGRTFSPNLGQSQHFHFLVGLIVPFGLIDLEDFGILRRADRQDFLQTPSSVPGATGWQSHQY